LPLLIERIGIGIIRIVDRSAPFLVAVKAMDNFTVLTESHAFVFTLAAVFMLVIHMIRSLLG
jgi:hypothetical protein